MLTIYGCYRSRASRNIWLAEELGLSFRLAPVIQAYRLADPAAADAPLHTRAPAFLKVNPNGHIPAIDDDGVVLNESLAINLYLARKHGGPLAPADLAEEGRMLMWSFWAAIEVEPHSIQIYYNRLGKPPAERSEPAVQAAIAALRAPFAVLDAHLGEGGGWAVGRRFTVADVNLAEILRYAQPAAELFDAAPRIRAWIEACQARPAFRRMWEAREREPA